MHPIKRFSLALGFIVLVQAGFANANSCDKCLGDPNCAPYAKKMQDNVVAAKQKELTELLPKPANEYFSTGTCIDTILNTRINIFTFPGLDQILDKVTQAVVNKACSFVLGSWNQVVSDVNTKVGTSVNVPYIGNVGSVGVGSGAAGSTPITINGSSVTTSTVPNAVNSNVTNVINSVNSTVGKVESTVDSVTSIFK